MAKILTASGTPGEFLPLLVRRIDRDKPMPLRVVERVVEGKIVEHHAQFDALARMQQIGALPAERVRRPPSHTANPRD